MEDLLPTGMPTYVTSPNSLFGASALSALGVRVLTGVLLSLFGPERYHGSRAGRFVNSLHFWGVQVLFGALLAYLKTLR